MHTFRGIARRVVVLSSGDVYLANDVLYRKIADPVQPTPLSETALLRTTRYPYRGVPVPAIPWVDSDHYEKIEVEEVALSMPALPGTILRLPMLYGPGAYDFWKRRFFPYFKRIDDQRESILLNNAMAQWCAPWSYTGNAAEAVALTVENERAAGQIYNVCEQGRPTIADWIREIAAVTGWRGQVLITSKPCPPPDMSSQLNLSQHLDMDSTRIRAELGYREPVPRIEALAQTAAWEREHPPSQIDPKQFDYTAEDALIATIHPG